MATTKAWSVSGPAQLGLRFADGDGSAWCIHTVPSWVRRITVYNAGTGELRVSHPGAAGNFGATDHYQPIPAGASVSWAISAGASQPTALTFGTFGADGAAHVMRITLEASASS